MNGPISGAPVSDDSSSTIRRRTQSSARRSHSKPGAANPNESNGATVAATPGSSWWTRHWGDAPGWLISVLFHAALLLILALITVSYEFRDRLPEILAVVGQREQAPAAEELETTPEAIELAVSDAAMSSLDIQNEPSTMDVPIPLEEQSRDEVIPGLDEFASLESIPDFGSPELSGRTGFGKSELIAREGGTPESEAAVALGLQWLANHQNRDGSWSFDHRTRQCGSDCTHPGSLAHCTTGATGMALLCFLGAGQSEQSGEYKNVVRQGVRFLASQSKSSRKMAGNLMGLSRRGRGHEGMYAQGIATLALCEAYNLGQNPTLRKPAQNALDFIVQAQDTRGGGWRYQPGERGDTSVVGWQVMALYSGRIAELNVPQQSLEAAWGFLDSVQSDEGAGYGYMQPGATPTLSAVGLLSRMYLGKPHGWDTDHPSVKRGAAQFASLGPSPDNMYYNYYATQFMYQYGGELWKQWNETMRDQLVSQQSKTGHAAGSWRPICPRGTGPGGRLYMTAMCVLTLEVYYRHLPIYARSKPEPSDEAGDVAKDKPAPG